MAQRILTCPKCKAHYEAANVLPGARVRCRKCNTIFKAPRPKQPKKDKLVGKTVGGYTILEKIGQGGIGSVYRAKQLSLDREVAFKTLKPEFASNASFVARLTREARSAAQLVHPNVVQTYDVGSDQGVHFIAMELVPGQSLQDVLSRKGRMDIPRALQILKQAAFGLQGAYHRAIVHRDIKPENLLLMEDGTVKISDFGLAKRIETDASVTQSGAIIGTPRYMSPEQAEGRDIDCRSDIYSLGATIYHAIAGVPPFEAPTAMGVIIKHLNEPLAPLRQLNPRVPPKMAAVIETMMAKDPNNRYQNPMQLLQAVEDVESTLESDLATVDTVVDQQETVIAPGPVPATPPESIAVAAKKRRTTPLRVMLLSLVTLVCVGFVLVIIQVHTRRARRDRELNTHFDRLKAEAHALSREDKYQAAINVFDAFPPSAPKEWHQEVAAEKKALKTIARERYDKVVESAEENGAEGDFEKALWQYEMVIENYGIPEIVEDAREHIGTIKEKQQALIASGLEEIEEMIRKDPQNLRHAGEQFRGLLHKFARAQLTDELRATINRIETSFKRFQPRSRTITVSKTGDGRFRTVSEAIRDAYSGDVIEIADSETYHEPLIGSLKTNITIRGTGDTPPRIQPPIQKPRPKLAGMAAFQPLIMASSGWHIENIILDGRGTFSGILMVSGGELTVKHSAIINTATYGLCLGSPKERFRRMMPREKVRKLSFSAEIRNSVLSNVGKDIWPAIVVNLGDMERLSFRFDHNIIYGAESCFAWMGDSIGRGDIHVTNSIFAHVKTFMRAEVAKFNAELLFDHNCYSTDIQAFLLSRAGQSVSGFAEWQKRISSDGNSVHKDPLLVAADEGNYALADDSPCKKRGTEGSDIGLLSPISIAAKFVERPMAKPPGRRREVPSKPTLAAKEEKKLDSAKLANLIKAQKFDEALKLCESIEGDPQWKRQKTDYVKRIIDLKSQVVNDINHSKNVPVRVNVAKRDKNFIGGYYVQADKSTFTISTRDNEKKTLKWADLDYLEFYEIADACLQPTDYRHHLGLGIYLYECGELPRAEERLNYVKTARKAPECDIASALLETISQDPSKEEKSATKEQAKESGPSWNRAWLELKEAIDRRDPAAALDCLDQACKALKGNPKDAAMIRYRFGLYVVDVARRYGQSVIPPEVVKRGVAALQEAIELDPDAQEAQTAKLILAKFQENAERERTEGRAD